MQVKLCHHAHIPVIMLTYNLSMTTCNIITRKCNIISLACEIIMLLCDLNKLHVNIIIMHVDIIYLACRRYKYDIILYRYTVSVFQSICHQLESKHISSCNLSFSIRKQDKVSLRLVNKMNNGMIHPHVNI